MAMRASADPGKPDLALAALARDNARRQRDRVLARQDQRTIDGEVRKTRLAMLRALRWRGGREALAFLDEDFLAVADGAAIYQAIITAAMMTSGAEFVDLQLRHPGTAALRIVAQYGFTSQFLTSFAVVEPASPTACAAAMRSGRPVLIDDIARSEIFAGQSTRDAVLQAGSRAVYSYPLTAPGGQVAGVLSYHYRRSATCLDAAELVATGAAEALSVVAP
jgi:hypothetical protein